MSDDLFNPSDLYGDTFDESPVAAPAGDFEIDDFEAMVSAGTREESRSRDANLPRYGVAILNPLPLATDASPYFYLGDFNIKHDDPRKGNRVNVPFFPRLELLPFTTKSYPIPFEGRASLLEEEEAEAELQQAPESFDVSTIEATLRSSRRMATITAEKWSLQVYDRYKEEGFTLLPGLTGIESYNEARRLFKLVITTEAVLAAIPQAPRERLGFELAPPYVPEIIRYLSEFAPAAIRKAAASTDDLQVLDGIRVALLNGARIANTYCEKTLSQTEAAIARKEKRGYDLPDFIHRNAKPPRDLVAMIHLNRHPRELEALRIAEATGSAVAAAAGRFQSAPPPAPAPLEVDTFTREDVDALLARQRAEFDATLADFRKEILGAQVAPEDDSQNNEAERKPRRQKNQ